VSSISGSSNVLESLGYKFTNDVDTLRTQIDRAGICFMHAPLFHPALKSVGPIRKELGVKTFFNMLGPLVNPAQPQQQLVGVFSLELTDLYKHLHLNLDKSYTIVYDLNGYDEISLTGNAKVITNKGTEILTPQDFKSQKISQDQISGGDSV
ncbi:MAG TPA: anthranilate phosphoribosyltransferase, partial [Saprospiraceae bacterium]|nr:anthranilate phosphoribosyltransferase [Saprospiraceae bacterium]